MNTKKLNKHYLDRPIARCPSSSGLVYGMRGRGLFKPCLIFSFNSFFFFFWVSKKFNLFGENILHKNAWLKLCPDENPHCKKVDHLYYKIGNWSGLCSFFFEYFSLFFFFKFFFSSLWTEYRKKKQCKFKIFVENIWNYRKFFFLHQWYLVGATSSNSFSSSWLL